MISKFRGIVILMMIDNQQGGNDYEKKSICFIMFEGLRSGN